MEYKEEWCEEYILEDHDSIQEGLEYWYSEGVRDLPSNLRMFHMQEVEKVVSTHLTEADANWFIKRKQHDYPKLYTYVESAYWSPQLKKLQDWIISLSITPPNS